MSKKKITYNHQFTVKQLESLLVELAKITHNPEIDFRPNFIDINVQRSYYVNEIFLSFMDITDPDYPKGFLHSIGANGKVDEDARKNMEFNSLADRVSFFTNLEDVIIDGINLNNV